MKVLFLDLDGPMFPDRVISHHIDNKFTNSTLQYLVNKFAENGDTFGAKCLSYWRMDETAVHMLNQLMDIQPFQTVLSSTWRELFSKESIELLFNMNSLNLVFHDMWCTPLRISPGPYDMGRGRSTRHSEIQQHIEQYNIKDYVILDDPLSGSGLELHKPLHKVIMVNPTIGIEINHFRDLKKLLVD